MEFAIDVYVRLFEGSAGNIELSTTNKLSYAYDLQSLLTHNGSLSDYIGIVPA